MIPYFAMQNVTHALFVSIGITAVVLLVFGYIKNWVTVGTKRSALWGAVQTLIVGALAAGTSYGIIRDIDYKDPTLIRMGGFIIKLVLAINLGFVINLIWGS
jgi:vacuolar iron transporter family protein